MLNKMKLKMEKLNNKLVLIFTFIIFAAGWSGWFLLKHVFHVGNIQIYPLIPAFFFVLGTSVINIVTHINRDNEQRVTNFYLMLKLGKFILSAIFVLIIYFLVTENLKIILLTFACFYLIYIFCEVFIYSQVEKAEKAQKKK